MTHPEIKVFPDLTELAVEAADRLLRIADEAIALEGRFTVALAGGSTPRALYELLATDEFRSAIDWARVEVFFGDERCVPPDHTESNYRMAREAMLGKLPLPGDNIYRMRGEIEPEAAAREYGQMLKEKFGDAGGLDLVLLGMGGDGHTASLFPGSEAIHETRHRVVATFAENSSTGRSWRITMTPPFINRARHVMILVAGASKSQCLQEVLEGPRDPQRLPVQLIAPESGRLTWLLDAAVAGMDDD
jgi:6-phosphogluconolactonase